MATEAQGLLRPPSWRDVANEARYQALPAAEKAKVFDAWTARAEEYGMATGRLSYEALEVPEQWDGQERPWAQWKANMRGALEAEREIEKREDPGQWAGILNALRRGVAAMEAGRKTVETREAVESAEMIRDNVGRRAEAAEATVGAGARMARAQARSEGRELTQEEEERQQSAVARGEQAAAETRAQLIGRAEEQDRSAERAAGQAADAAGLVDFYRSAEGVRAFHEAEGGVESAKAFARNPVEIIAATLAESTAPMAQAIVTGAAGGVRGGKAGMAGGAFLGALTAEMTMGTVDALSESGVDYSDPASILAAVQDEEKWQAARERAFRGGVPRAAFDSVGMVLGARLAGMTGESVTRRIVAGTVGEAALGATGETAGQLAESGTVTSGKEIFLEGIAELGMGAGGAVTQLASRLARGQVSGAGGSSAPGQQGAGPSTGSPATTPQATPIDVEVLPPETLPSSQRPAQGTDPQATPGTRTPEALPAPNRLAYPDLTEAAGQPAFPELPAPNRLADAQIEQASGPAPALAAPPQRALPAPEVAPMALPAPMQEAAPASAVVPPAAETAPATETQTTDSPTPETRYVDPSRDPAVLGIVGADPALRMWDVASRWLRSRGGLPQGAFESKVAAEAAQRAMRSVATQNVRALESAINQVLPPLRQGLRAREAERTRLLREVNEFMTGARRLGDLPAQVRPVAREMRAHVDRLSNTLVSEGVVQGPLVQIFMANQGTYLNRAYRIFDDPTWRERVPADVRNRALGFFRQQNPRQPHETPQAFETRVRNQVEEMLDVGDQVRGAMAGGGSISRKGLQILKKRKAIAPEIRALWGEYTDAESNYARTISKMSQLVASHRFLTAMRADGLGKYLFPREQAPPGHIYQISAEGNAALSPLDGLVTTKEIKDALELAFAPRNSPWWLVGWFRANGIAKHSKTVLSPITHIRNFTSNMIYTLANGNVPNLLHGGAARVTAADLFPQRVLEALRRRGRKVDDWRAYHRRLVELGVVGDDVRAGELYDTVKDAVGHGLDFVEHAESVWKRTAGRGAKWVARTYQAEDAFWKVVNFEAERRKYGAAYPQWSQQQLDETAARIVRDNMPTYALVPRAAKIVRQFPLAGPFVSFSAEVIRNTGNIARLAVREMGDPATRSIGVRRMAGLIAAQSLPVAAVMMGRAISGTDEEDEAATRALAAPWDRNAMLMMLPPTEEGHGRFVNLSYIDPFAMLKTPIVAWTREDLEGLDESLLQSVLQFTEPFHSEEIFSQAMQEIAANKKRGGGQIFNPQAPLWHRAQEILAHLWSAVEPGFISQGMRVHKAATKQQTHYGRTYDLQTELTALATGQRVVTLDPVDALSWAARKYRGERSETTAIFTQVLSRAGTVRDEELEAAWETMQRSRAKLMRRMSLSVDGAARLGVSRRDLEAILKAEQAGSEAERAALIQGRVIPWRMTDAQIDRAATRPGRIRQVLRVIGPQAFDERGLQRALRNQAKAPPPRPVLTPAGR